MTARLSREAHQPSLTLEQSSTTTALVLAEDRKSNKKAQK